MATTAPLVSIVLGTYNQAPYLGAAIDSALGQTHPKIEVILVDNGSTDGTADVLARYAGVPNLRIQRHARNGAVTKALNEALDDAQGEFVSFLFGDDYYLAEKTERQLSFFATLSTEHGVVFGPGYRLSERTGERWVPPGRGPSGWVARDLLAHFHSASLVPISPLIRRRCLERYRFHEDIFLEGTESLLLRLALSYQFGYLPEPLVVMREHAGNHGKAYRRNTEYNLVLLDKLAREEAFPADLRGVVTTVKAQSLRSLGWTTARLTSDGAAARAAFLAAARMQKRQALHWRTLAGVLLSLVPGRLRGLLNGAGFSLRRHRSGLEYLDDA
ncbi:MAG: glycosyltransferase [Thermoleophilia bacterium]|nr:glycosyltransferase [Thermoleophilia bacterium]